MVFALQGLVRFVSDTWKMRAIAPALFAPRQIHDRFPGAAGGRRLFAKG
ncbi:hypothetical protein [Arenibaculum sp.]|jgi:hypothetical protein|nr:hypothetical protein [Arenibaculum sp.]